ncbi:MULTISPECIES: nitrilase family protein [Bordetella]|uniref:CN hydrolase domain-containing protein n=3 Tax=Bordetella TaxID=517 RepID=A0A0C6P6P1_BORBO|nr:MULTISPECIES: nitrilase family protein [Bordetella]SHR42880.1 nitrilase/cyanide hydratase and apolipoprotein N-acyltransferase [Mycobacteroides abscessus subsp. abscessus]AOB26087.1 hypothetical protein BBB44_07390 [Bordetella bronchiseptica]AWP74351.1 hypothetical protein B7P10_07715 [Bordetella bronchiseptica]AZW21150.1 hypothetical protein CS345_07640 [Bordetella bronchiseptica]AZW43372.1 hypothetical protein CWR61_07465 [Bordetella bronchiseptica]
MTPTGKIAAIQFDVRQGENDANRARSCALARQAAAAGARLIVLPECCIGGLVFDSRDEIRAVSETVPGPSTRAWSQVSRETGAWIVAGLSETDGEKIYNTAVLVGPGGELHRHRKLHVRGNEQRLFDVGDALTRVDTPLGRIGLAICYDMWFPEVCRNYALDGVDVVAAPANWSKSIRTADAFDAYGLPQGYHLMAATAVSNELVVVAADRVGTERGVAFLGTSCIFGPSGEELCPAASRGEEQILLADWPDIATIRAQGGPHLGQRQPAVYPVVR